MIPYLVKLWIGWWFIMDGLTGKYLQVLVWNCGPSDRGILCVASVSPHEYSFDIPTRNPTGICWNILKLVGGLEHLDYCSHHIGNVIIPTDELIFFRGVGIPPIYWNMFVTRTNFAVAVTRAPYRRGFMSLTGWPEMMRSPWLFPHSEETLHAKWLKLEKPPRIICFWLELGVQVVT